MQRVIHDNGVVTYTFDSLVDQPVFAHVSTRHGGVSPAPWNTLNFSVARGDTRERVEENRRRFAEAAGNATAHDHVRAISSPLTALLATGVHSAAYLAVTGLAAWVVYRKLGLALLRTAWFNLDLLWAFALVGAGVILLASALW